MIKTIPNITTPHKIFEHHTLDIPPCCPISKNPRPGSILTISYRPDGCSLEIASLIARVHEFVGGLRSDQGELLVRDMEGMLATLADECAQALRVRVRLTASLQLLPRQHMSFVARGFPQW